MADLNIGNSSSSVVVNAKHNGSVIPQIDNTYDLGTSDLRWKNIYGNLKGNADTATKLATAKTISLTGSVTGSGTFDGSGNLSIATTTNHTHNYAGSASAGGSANSAVKLDTTTAGDSNTPVYFSGGKPVACTSLDLNTSGNAASASKVNNKLTVGSKTYDGSAAVTIYASDLGLASAMLFLGTTTTAITDGATTNPVAISGSNKTVTAGNVVLYGSKEFVWTGSAWEELGNEGSYKIVQAAVADPSASGTSNTFIDTISQDTNGKITATKKTVAVTNSAPTLTWGATSTIGTVAGTNLQVKMPANPNTDTKVTQTVTTSNAAYPLLLAPNGQTDTTTTTSYFDSGVTLNPSTNTIAANISGNAATATTATQDGNGKVIATEYVHKTNSSSTLNQFSGAPKYLLGIEAFADGGEVKWQGVSDIKVGSAGNADTVDGYHHDAFVKRAGDTMTGTLGVPQLYINNPDWVNDTFLRFREGGSEEYGAFIAYGSGDSFKIGTRDGNTDYTAISIARGSTNVTVSGNLSASKVYGAVWNDYAEYRETHHEIEPGRCVIEVGDGSLTLSFGRLQPGANIVSDTFGFAIGETEINKTPLAVSGRVLAYPNEPRESYHPGDPVCSGPNGTISRMTREEVREWPDRIVGTVSEIPTYEKWGTGNVEVNGRIWIRIR